MTEGKYMELCSSVLISLKKTFEYSNVLVKVLTGNVLLLHRKLTSSLHNRIKSPPGIVTSHLFLRWLLLTFSFSSNCESCGNAMWSLWELKEIFSVMAFEVSSITWRSLDSCSSVTCTESSQPWEGINDRDESLKHAQEAPFNNLGTSPHLQQLSVFLWRLFSWLDALVDSSNPVFVTGEADDFISEYEVWEARLSHDISRRDSISLTVSKSLSLL